jgi:hypothetical protein
MVRLFWLSVGVAVSTFAFASIHGSAPVVTPSCVTLELDLSQISCSVLSLEIFRP